jgi:hypothetical protein
MTQSKRVWGLRVNMAGVGIVVALGACTPRVEVAAPDKPITINLNVKIDHEIRVKVDKELDKVLSDDSGLF